MENVSLNFGPIETLLTDDTISEIMVNRFDQIFIERQGKLLASPQKFPSELYLQDLIQSIARSCGREVSPTYPCMDGYLPDGPQGRKPYNQKIPKSPILYARLSSPRIPHR